MGSRPSKPKDPIYAANLYSASIMKNLITLRAIALPAQSLEL